MKPKQRNAWPRAAPAVVLLLAFMLQMASAAIIARSNCEVLMGWKSYYRYTDDHDGDADDPPSATCSPLVECTKYPGVLNCSDDGHVTNLNLAFKGLGGTLPASWAILDELKILRLEGNGIQGTLPPEWRAFPKLENLNLSRNLLTGTLPAEWSAMRAMDEFDLSRNRLWGQLPSQWGKMAVIREVTVSHNNLTGNLPRSWAYMTQLAWLYITNTTITIGRAYPTARCLVRRNRFNIVDINHPNGFDVRELCVQTTRTRAILAASLVAGFLLLLTIVIAIRRRKPTPEKVRRAAESQQQLLLAIKKRTVGAWLLRVWHGPGAAEGEGLKGVVKAVSGVAPVISILWDLISDIWILVQVAPRHATDTLWPFIALLVALFIPNTIGTFSAWASWLTVSNNRHRSLLTLAGLTCLYINPFSASLLIALIMSAFHSLTHWHRARLESRKLATTRLANLPPPPPTTAAPPPSTPPSTKSTSLHTPPTPGSSKPSPPPQPLVPVASTPGAAPLPLWPTPCQISATLDMEKHEALLGLSMALTEDPMSIAVTTAFFLINKRNFGQVLRTRAYVVNVLSAFAHMLFEAWRWTPLVRDGGWGVLREALDLRRDEKAAPVTEGVAAESRWDRDEVPGRDGVGYARRAEQV